MTGRARRARAQGQARIDLRRAARRTIVGGEMARAPYQVLVMPFRRGDDGAVELACLRRTDDDAWQGIAGGGEGDETPPEAARREVREEAGVSSDAPLYALQSRSSIPVSAFASRRDWPADLWVVPEHAFALDCTGQTLRLSDEHNELVWGSYEMIHARLRWDSNRTALWELHERLLRGALGPKLQ